MAVLFGVLVLALGTTLLVIGARSPYTHGNLAAGVDPSYGRTPQTVVGSPVPYEGAGRVSASLSGADPVTRGASVYVNKGCTGCHGLWGRGGTVGPEIAGAPAEKIHEKALGGPGGMPVFARDALSTEELELIVAYLRAAPKR